MSGLRNDPSAADPQFMFSSRRWNKHPYFFFFFYFGFFRSLSTSSSPLTLGKTSANIFDNLFPFALLQARRKQESRPIQPAVGKLLLVLEFRGKVFDEVVREAHPLRPRLPSDKLSLTGAAIIRPTKGITLEEEKEARRSLVALHASTRHLTLSPHKV